MQPEKNTQSIYQSYPTYNVVVATMFWYCCYLYRFLQGLYQNNIERKMKQNINMENGTKVWSKRSF